MAERGAPIGNQYAAKGRIWTDALKRAIARRLDGDLQHGLDKLADQLVAAGMEQGERWALEHIADRLEGKATEHKVVDQTVTVEVGNARTLATTLRALEQPAEVTGLTVQ